MGELGKFSNRDIAKDIGVDDLQKVTLSIIRQPQQFMSQAVITATQYQKSQLGEFDSQHHIVAESQIVVHRCFDSGKEVA
jgi:F0F1-type ATP synthase beta subunit